MTKAQKLIVSLLLIAAILFAFFTFVPLALAEESPDGTVTEEPSEDVQEPPQESGEGQTLVDQFIQSLKDKYGADYERYYNFIIEQWGSVEEYLIAMGEDWPEEAQDSWNRFVAWLDRYAVIWVPILAIAMVIIVYFGGKKFIDKRIANAVDKKVTPVNAELNKQSAAQAAQMKAMRALLGKNEKFAEVAKELENREKELTQ